MTLRTLALCCCVLLAGCAADHPEPRRFQRADAELARAARPPAAAPLPDAVASALLPPVTVPMPRVEPRAAEPRFDLNVNNALASEVFMAIVAGTRYSMVVYPSVKERVSVNLKAVTVFEALDTLRDVYGYEYKVQGNRILVQAAVMEGRLYRVNYLLSSRKGRSEVRINSGAISDNSASTTQSTAGSTTTQGSSGARALESSRVETTADANFWGELATTLRAMVGTDAGRSVIVNAQAGLVLVRAFPAEQRAVAEFLQTLQGVVARQVMLEAKIIQVQLSDGSTTGINWSAFRGSAGGNARLGGGMVTPGGSLSPSGALTAYTTLGPDGSVLPSSNFTVTPGAIAAGSVAAGLGNPGGVFGLAFQTSNFAALLDFLQTQGHLQVLSSPRIATLNNQKAVLKVGTDEFFVTNVTTNQTTTTGGAVQNSPSITVQPFFSGIALDVTPQIDGNNQIILHVHPSVSLVVDKTKTINLGQAGTFSLPLASSDISETDTVVSVGDGNIVAIGGLMKDATTDSTSRIPGLGDLPVVGGLFRNSARSTVKSELVILLRPTVVHSDESWSRDLDEARARVSSLEAAAPRAAPRSAAGKP